MKIEKRAIRIFISSTFRDMMPEREYLMKMVFPELRKRCKKKFVEVTEVDLRWGILEEDSKEGKVIEICLNEIDKSRPYFIGLLGDRYGWVPSKEEYQKHAKIIEDYPWVKKDIEDGLSITEMEFQYGVLRNTEMTGKAYFYLKHVVKTKDEPSARLIKLKEKLRSQDTFPVNDYQTVEQLGQLILEDLWKEISEEFPDEKIPDDHVKEKLDQLLFLNSHLDFFYDHSDLILSIDHTLETKNKVLLFGEKGLGKSAFLSNWIKIKWDNQVEVIHYFCGSTAESTELGNMVKFLARAIKDQFDIPYAIPDRVESPKSLLEAFIGGIDIKRNVYIVLDGIEQLQFEENNTQLRWLPDDIPANVNIIISTSNDEFAGILRKKNYQEAIINPLPPAAVRTIAENYFSFYSKKLPELLMNQVSHAPVNAKPVALLTLLNELRLFGNHEELPDQIAYYTQKSETGEFFQAFLQRLEDDFAGEKFKIDRILSLLMLARKGLTETEILEVAGIAPISWSQLFNMLNYHLINKNGHLSISNAYLKEAIQQRYLSDQTYKTTELNQLAEYFYTIFSSFEFDSEPETMARVVDELPDLLFKLEDQEKMKTLLTFVPVLLAIFEKRHIEIGKYFGFLRQYYNLGELFSDPVQAFIASDLADEKKIKGCYTIAHTLMANDNPRHAVPYYYKALEIHNQTKSKSTFVFESLKELSVIYNNLGHFEASAYILENLLPYQREEGIAESFDLLGQLYTSTGNFAKAEVLTRDALLYMIDRFGGNSLSAAVVYNNLGRVFDLKKDVKQAEENYRNSAKIARDIYGENHPLYQKVQSNLGILLMHNGQLEGALELFSSVLEIRRSVYGNNHPLTFKTMNSLGVCNLLLGDYDKADPLLSQAFEGQKATLGETHSDTMITLSNISDLLLRQKKYQEAGKIQQRILDHNLKSYGEVNQHTILSGLALAETLYKEGKKEEAATRYREVAGWQTQYYGEDHAYVKFAKFKAANINIERKKAGPEDFTDYMDWYLFKAHQNMEEEDYPNAEFFFKQVVELCTRLVKGAHPAYFSALSGLSALYLRWKKYNEAAHYCSLMEDQAKEAMGDKSKVFLKFKVLRAYNLYKAGNYAAVYEILVELGDSHEVVLNFDEAYISKMYREMLGFLHEFHKVLENYNNNKEKANQVFMESESLVKEAVAKQATGVVEDVLAYYDQAIDKALLINETYGQSFSGPYYTKAQFLEGIGRKKEAIDTLLEGIKYLSIWNHEYAPPIERFALKLGQLLAEQGMGKEALFNFNNAQKINSMLEDYPNAQTLSIHSGLIMLLAKLERFKDALALIDETIPLSNKISGEENALTKSLLHMKNEIVKLS